MSQKHDLLKHYYGYDSFRSGQEDIIDNILAGRDILAVMPTGAGKSICYQIPALILGGITLVISPLISLMKDQVGALNQNGIRAAYLNSSLTLRQYKMALDNIRAGVYKIIYIAPERLLTDGFLELTRELDIPLVAVDEAHCVSEWGHDFRRSYMDIATFIKGLSRRPVVAAFTATATGLVKSDIKGLLKLRRPYEITTGFDRPNLYFAVVDTEDRYEYLRSYLDDNPGKSGIIYAMTRKIVEDVYSRLFKAGYPVTYYHAGLSDIERAKNQEDFIKDIKPIMVATNAFGMGIDKPDVSFIVHFNMPKSMEAYYQEAGRAGRDGSESDCILLYSPVDINLAKFIIDKGTDAEGELDPGEFKKAKERQNKKLREMISYCKTTDCLRGYILRYFGEKPREKKCNKCSSCRSCGETVDVTAVVRGVYMAVELSGERYGGAFIADLLHGTDNGRMDALGYLRSRCFGMLSEIPVSVIRDVIDRMVIEGLLTRSDGMYPTLSIDPSLKDFIAAGGKMTIKKRATKESGRKKRPVMGYGENLPFNTVLYEKLREFRRATAEKRGVPAYVIFTDMTLRELAINKPTNMVQLLTVRGIGVEKAERYGTAVISIVKACTE